MKQVVTTKIEKKWKDKKTGEWKTITIDYAKVADRLKEFRSDTTDSKISTIHKVMEDGTVVFKAYVWKDKAEFLDVLKATSDREVALLSADSEGTARSNDDGEKSFEKLETIAVGRALALLGYAVSGAIASSEEMEAYEKYRSEKVEDAREEIGKATKGREFEAILAKLSPAQQKEVTPIIKTRMRELKDAQ